MRSCLTTRDVKSFNRKECIELVHLKLIYLKVLRTCIDNDFDDAWLANLSTLPGLWFFSFES